MKRNVLIVLHGKKVLQYFLNYKRQRLHLSHFGKLLQSSTDESKIFNPATARIVLLLDLSTIYALKVLELL